MSVPTLHLPDDDEETAQISNRRYSPRSQISDIADDVERAREDPAGSVTELMGTSNELDTRLLLPVEPAPPSLATVEPPSFPDLDSVDDFIFELDEGTEPSLDPPDTSFAKAPSLLSRVSNRLRREPSLSDGSSTIASSITAPSIRSSFTNKYAATLASAGAFCFEYLESRPCRIYSVRTFCESLFKSSRVVGANIVSAKRYGDRNGVLHRFLILHVVRTDGKDFYLRLDRRRDPKVPLLAFGMQGLQTRLAKDTVAISGRLEHLHDYTKAGEEAAMSFETPPPLIAAAQILYSITTESQGYKLTKENCWFFTSMVQDILVRNFGAQYENGILNHPKLASERRAQILTHAYHEARREADRVSDAVLRLTTLLENSSLEDGIKSFLITLGGAHEFIYHKAAHSAHRFARSAQELLVALDNKLDEHLHACCGSPGAPMLSSPADLLLHLARVNQRLPTLPHHPVPDRNDMQNIISAIENCAISTNSASLCTCDSVEHQLRSSSAFQLRMRRLALFMLERLSDCDKLDTLPEIWRLRLNDDIHELRSEFGKRISIQLQFICRRWIAVLCEANCMDDEIMEALSRRTQALRMWVAAMGIMGEMEQVCQGLNDLYVWLQVLDIKRTVYDLYRWVAHSKNALATSSLAILGGGHPFIPSNSPLHETFTGDVTSRGRIIAEHVDTSQTLPSQVLRMKTRSSINVAVFSPDGRHLVSAEADGTLCVWNAVTGTSLRRFKGQTDHVWSVAFSPDSSLLVSASDDGAVHVYDAVTGAPLRQLNGHTDWVWAVAFSPDGRYLASASDDGTARLWDAVTGISLRELKGHTGGVESVAFSPDGRHLASASADHTVRVWDVATGASIRELEGHTAWVGSVVFSPDGHYLASASHDCTVRVWGAVSGAPLQQLKGHINWVWSVVFSPDSRHLASASYDCTVCVWDALMGTLLQELTGHTNWVRSVSFSPDGRHVASASKDCTMRVWDVAKPSHVMPRWPRALLNFKESSFSFSADGSVLIVQPHLSSPTYLCFPSLEVTARPPRPLLPYSPIPSPFLFYLDKNCLCVDREGLELHIYWLPDYFEPVTPVIQHGNHVCIGGEDGMIACIDLDELSVPDL